ncbi:class I SAM-dependent methyltransferase [Thalassotalea fonticola]|uniref:Class I SAM-dependent methyltransferase n=1 Tax=Thalassotalea fonticola TaxID=3065649 RepID=A0ABZ0GLK4_9GAMM|nr:class I SAM-dependent methyltransferase [Colwelliaceae bacterium S1-1]
MSNEWDEYAEGWDIDPSVEVYANKAFAELVKKVNLDALTVLDFGCGTGALTQLISPEVKNIVAIDPSSEMIKCLDKKSLKNVATISDYLSEGIIKKHSRFHDKFDLVVASSVCGFLPSYEETLTLLKSVLKVGGTFIQWDWLAEDDSSSMGLSEARVRQAFESNQFIDIQVTSPFIMESSKGKMSVLMACGKNA